MTDINENKMQNSKNLTSKVSVSLSKPGTQEMMNTSSNIANSEMLSDKYTPSEYAVISGSPGFSSSRAAKVLADTLTHTDNFNSAKDNIH